MAMGIRSLAPKMDHFFLTCQIFFFIPDGDREPVTLRPQLCLLLSLCSTSVWTSLSTIIWFPPPGVISSSWRGAPVLPSTWFQNWAGLGWVMTRASFSFPTAESTGTHLLSCSCSSSSVPNIVRAWLSVPVWSKVLRPTLCNPLLSRLGRESDPGVAAEDELALYPDPGSRGVLRFRHICQIMGRLVQRIPPRGSKAEYAPSGTYAQVKSGEVWPSTTVKRSDETIQVLSKAVFR